MKPSRNISVSHKSPRLFTQMNKKSAPCELFFSVFLNELVKLMKSANGKLINLRASKFRPLKWLWMSVCSYFMLVNEQAGLVAGLKYGAGVIHTPNTCRSSLPQPANRSPRDHFCASNCGGSKPNRTVAQAMLVASSRRFEHGEDAA